MNRYLSLCLCSMLISAGCGGNRAEVEQPLPVQVRILETEMISETVYAPCRIEAGAEAVVSVGVAGIVEEILVAPGDTVGAGERLMALRTDDMRQAEILSAAASLSAARASQEFASSTLNRAEELFLADAMSHSQYQEAQTTAAAAEAALRQARAGYTAAVSSAGSGYVTAPFPGVVGRVIATTGNPASGPLLSIHASGVPEAELLLSPVHLHKLREGLPAVFQTDHYSGELFRGTVTSVAASADPLSGLVPVKVQFSDSAGALIPGISGMAMILLETRDNAIVMGEASLLPLGDCCWQAMVIRGGRAEATRVQTGIRNGNNHEVIEGLMAGDTVVTLGSTLVRDGEEVRMVNL